MAVASKQIGEVKWFDEERGYGFLMADGFPFNLFLHIHDLNAAGIDGSQVKKGMKLRFRVGSPPKPKGANDKCATDLERV